MDVRVDMVRRVDLVTMAVLAGRGGVKVDPAVREFVERPIDLGFALVPWRTGGPGPHRRPAMKARGRARYACTQRV